VGSEVSLNQSEIINLKGEMVGKTTGCCWTRISETRGSSRICSKDEVQFEAHTTEPTATKSEGARSWDLLKTQNPLVEVACYG
jgi:hypothetical protein